MQATHIQNASVRRVVAAAPLPPPAHSDIPEPTCPLLYGRLHHLLNTASGFAGNAALEPVPGPSLRALTSPSA
jgi:hypothetical protein